MKFLNRLSLLALPFILGVSSCKDDSGKTGKQTNPESAAHAGSAPVPPNPEVTEKLQKIAEERAGDSRGFLIYLRLDDGPEWTLTAGTRGEGGPKVTGQEHFRVGSITKLFTAVSILQLSETDALDLEAPLTRFFEKDLLATLVGGEKGDPDALRVRHLLNHTTGMGDYINIGSDAAALERYGITGDKVYTPAELLELTRSYTIDPSILPADHPPLPAKTLKGDGIESYDAMPGAYYSNTGYVMLGMIIEKASGQSYEDYVASHILKPLGLSGTGFATKGMKADFTGHAAGITDQPVTMSPSFAWSAGAAVTTTTDLAKFLEAALAGDLFQKDSTLSFWTKEGFKPLMEVPFLPQYGHGLMRKSIGDLAILGHDGQTFGATALVGRCEALGATIVLATNESQGTPMWSIAVQVLAEGRSVEEE